MRELPAVAIANIGRLAAELVAYAPAVAAGALERQAAEARRLVDELANDQAAAELERELAPWELTEAELEALLLPRAVTELELELEAAELELELGPEEGGR